VGGAEPKRAPRPVGQTLGQQRQDQLRQQAGPRQPGLLGLQVVEPDLALQPLERQLDLPAQAVERHDPLGRVRRGVERGQQTPANPPSGAA
jgi:hypothetical protein